MSFLNSTTRTHILCLRPDQTHGQNPYMSRLKKSLRPDKVRGLCRRPGRRPGPPTKSADGRVRLVEFGHKAIIHRGVVAAKQRCVYLLMKKTHYEKKENRTGMAYASRTDCNNTVALRPCIWGFLTWTFFYLKQIETYLISLWARQNEKLTLYDTVLLYL